MEWQQRIEALRTIVEQSTAAKIDGILVDLFTASMLVQIYDKLRVEQAQHFASMRVDVMADFGWKLIEKAKA